MGIIMTRVHTIAFTFVGVDLKGLVSAHMNLCPGRQVLGYVQIKRHDEDVRPICAFEACVEWEVTTQGSPQGTRITHEELNSLDLHC